MKFLCILAPWIAGLLTTAALAEPARTESWQHLETRGQPTARHEAAFVAWKGKFFLLGGRRINPVDVYDPATQTWTQRDPTPLELHHFQAVAFNDQIYLMGAMTGPYPRETPLERVVVYDPGKDEFRFTHPIPPERRRGGAGAARYGDKIYLVGGITNGHVDGYQAWFDEYDPATGNWRRLPDAPHARDHFQIAIIGDRLYAAGGRTTSQATKEVFSLTVSPIDVYDFKLKKWLPIQQSPTLPTPRAGNMVIAAEGQLIVAGGESGTQPAAHFEVEAFDPQTRKWQTLPRLHRGRHGSGLILHEGLLYTASGSGNRGGGPELTSIESLRLGPPGNQQ